MRKQQSDVIISLVSDTGGYAAETWRRSETEEANERVRRDARSRGLFIIRV